MKRSTFGVMAAGTVASLLGAVHMPEAAAADAKACYRTHCGKSITGHEGQCGGTKVDGLADQKACEAAGGAWTTEADATKFKKKS